MISKYKVDGLYRHLKTMTNEQKQTLFFMAIAMMAAIFFQGIVISVFCFN